MSTADRNLDRLLPLQHGTFSRPQAEAAGFTPRMVDRRLGAGQWRVLDGSVYAHAAYAATWEQRCIAAVLSEPRAALGGKTAAVVYQLPTFQRGALDLTVPALGQHPNRLAWVRRSSLFDPRVVNGFTVNSVPFVFVELATSVSFARLDRAFEDAILRRLTTMEEMGDWYLRLANSRRPGIGKLRAIIDRRDTGFVPAESELEALLFRALSGAGIPPITRQAPFPWLPDDARRVDGFIEAWDILLEADGRRWHARLQSMEDDRRRDQEAIRRGYLPLRFGWTDLRDDPARVRSIVIETGHHRRAA